MSVSHNMNMGGCKLITTDQRNTRSERRWLPNGKHTHILSSNNKKKNKIYTYILTKPDESMTFDKQTANEKIHPTATAQQQSAEIDRKIICTEQIHTHK